MIDNSYYIILNRLKAFANGHYLINTFTYHEIANFDISKNPHYPIMHAVPVSMNPTKGAIDYSFNITFADWVRAKDDKQENEVTVISDMHRCALDLCAEITNGNILFGNEVTINGDATIEPFIDEFANVLSGVTLQITIRIPYDWSACDIPANWVDGTGDIPDFGGRSLTMDIYDEGVFKVAAREMNFVGSGVTVTYTGNRAIVTINGGGGGGAVTSVNGQTGDVDLSASDVGADVSGSAASALTSANSYTDSQIASLTYSDVGADQAGAAASALTSANSYTDAEIAALTKSDVGLGNVDNTSDLNKPISTATQTALNAKEPTISAGTTAQYWRGDKSWQTLDKSAVGLSNVDNTSDLNKPISTATQTALDLKANASQLPLIYKSTTDSNAITGTTGVTYVRSVLIPANTFQVGDVIRIRQRGRKTGAAGVTTMGIYINTLDQFSGSTILGAYTTTAASHLWVQMKRDFYIKSATSTEGMTASGTAPTDEISFATAATSTNINWAVNQYIIFTVNPNSAADSYRQSGYIIERL